MEGLSNSSATNAGKKYVQTFNEHFVVRTVKENPEAVNRLNKAGNEVYELQYDTLKGTINDIQITTHELEINGKKQKIERLEIDLLADLSTLILVLPVDSGHAFNFYKRMENINYMEPVTFQLWKYDNPFLAVVQNDKLIPSKYTKDDIPAWKEVLISGKTFWDKTEALSFFKSKLKIVVDSLNLHGNTAKKPAIQEIEKDDLPW